MQTGSTDRLLLDVPSLERMEQATSCQQLWRNLNNDQVFRFGHYYRLLTGKDISLIDEHRPEIWAVARQVIVTLRNAVSFANCLLDLATRTGSLREVSDWLEGQRSVDPAVNVAADIIKWVRHELFLNDLPVGGSLEIDELVTLRREGFQASPWEGQTFDAFISYRHRDYLELASALQAALEGRAFRCWLDRVALAVPAGTRLADIVLKRHLRAGLQASKGTIFFETTAEATVDEDFRGNQTAFNWQVFEHRYARQVAYVRPKTGLVEFGLRTEHWADIDDLAERIGGWLRPLAEPGPPSAPDEPDLRSAVAELERQLSDYFGVSVVPSAMAALAMLAPGRRDEAGNQAASLGDDVLVNLVRYDATSALMVEAAALDPYALLAAGSKVTEGRWRHPNGYLVPDVFGHDDYRSANIIRGGRLRAIDVLAGIVEYAQRAPSAGRELVDRALKNHDPYASEETRTARRNEALDHLSESIAAFGDADAGGHGWLFVHGAQGWRPVPVVRTERFDVGGREVIVMVRQAHRLFAEELVAGLASALGDPASVPQFLQEHPDVAMTLGTDWSVLGGFDVTGPDDDTPMFVGDWATRRAVGSGGADGAAAVLTAARPGDAPDSLLDPLPLWQPVKALLVTDPPDNSPTAFSSTITLTIQVLARLWRHRGRRDLDYDDF